MPDIKTFRAGRFEKQLKYKSFLPAPVNRSWMIDDPEVLDLLSNADRSIGELNAFSRYVPDIDFFLGMYETKEATTSNRIEGTITTFEEALQKEQEIAPESREDWREVQNYIAAMHFAIDRLKSLPVCNRLLKETHAILLQGVRGSQKSPGEFRVSQNWIGGASLKDAVFIPPHPSRLAECMGDLENFLNSEEIRLPHLLRVGIAHYHFESIHPFLDGNGRLGRLLITLYLVSKGVLEKPALYLSDFFDRNRDAYYDNLRRVQTRGELKQWLKFFLVGVQETADSARDTFRAILGLKTDLETNVIPKMGRRRERAKELLRHLFSSPVLSASDVTDFLSTTPITANRMIAEFVEHGILQETTGKQRNRIFRFGQYLELFE